MIRNTFSIFDGLGERSEKNLWRNGVLSWNDFLFRKTIPFFGNQRKAIINESIHCFMKELEERNEKTFSQYVKRSEHWRFFEVFRDNAVCLDIETNGLSPTQGGFITMVGIYNGNEYRCFIRGENLTEERLIDELHQYKFLITFFGSVFDVPFLVKCFPRLEFDMLHFDLCTTAKRIGLRGGLKRIEKHLGIEREGEVDGLNGFDAVKLWRLYESGKTEALHILGKYNREDTVNLLRIGEYVYSEMRRATGIEEYIREV